MIYIIVGKSCSGKTSVKEYFEKQGKICFEASKYMKESMSKYKLSPRELFEKFGKDFVSKLIYQDISEHEKNSPIIISGLRTPEEIKFFKSKLKTKIIGISASDKTCFQRNIDRNREDVETNYENFIKKRIEFNSLIGLSEVFKNNVDIWIQNENTIEELQNKLNKLLGGQK